MLLGKVKLAMAPRSCCISKVAPHTQLLINLLLFHPIPSSPATSAFFFHRPPSSLAEISHPSSFSSSSSSASSPRSHLSGLGWSRYSPSLYLLPTPLRLVLVPRVPMAVYAVAPTKTTITAIAIVRSLKPRYLWLSLPLSSSR